MPTRNLPGLPGAVRLLLVAMLALAAALAGAQTAKRIEDVIYLKQGGAAFTLDVFQPVKPNGKTVINLVSGGWVSDHADINLGLAKVANERGFTVVQVVHGAQPRYKVSEIVRQVARAVRFVKANAGRYGIDPKRMGIMGGSAGGHLSLYLAATAAPGEPTSTDPVEREDATVQAVGVFFPPTDFENWGKPGALAFDNPFLRTAFGNAFVPDQRTATKETMDALSKQLSPIQHFTAKMPPTLLIHGDKDALVPIQQSEIALARLQELGVDAQLIVVPGAGHGWPDMVPQVRQILDWFEAKLPKA